MSQSAAVEVFPYGSNLPRAADLDWASCARPVSCSLTARLRKFRLVQIGEFNPIVATWEEPPLAQLGLRNA